MSPRPRFSLGRTPTPDELVRQSLEHGPALSQDLETLLTRVKEERTAAWRYVYELFRPLEHPLAGQHRAVSPPDPEAAAKALHLTETSGTTPFALTVGGAVLSCAAVVGTAVLLNRA